MVIFKDNYRWLSGWIHDYYCDKDGSPLVFDENNNIYFECPICHYKYKDDRKRRAWVTKYRYKIFDMLEEYSKQYLLEKKDYYLTFIENALKYYSANYVKFEIHDKDGEIFDSYINESNRCGKITSQGLNEAMMAIQFVNCLSNISYYLDEDIKDNVYELFNEIFCLLKPQINKIHNIQCYEISAIGMMGIISGNQKMIDFAFHSEYSFYKQLDSGITKDYFWFEGSFHYHLFVLKPILSLLSIAKKFKYNIDTKYYNLAKMMLIQCYKCSFSDCSLPSPNDGWPNRHLSDYIQVFELGNKLFANELDEILKSINNKKNNNNTIHLINTGFSVLKNKYWNVFIKYKDNNINHAHPDKLNIEIKHNGKYLTHDLSTAGYGSNISKHFYRKTYAHNTIVIDGKNQNIECNNIIENFDENMIYVKVNNAYDECEISRRIVLKSEIIDDMLIVNGKKNKIIDYFFHCDAKLLSIPYSNPIQSMNEYQYLDNIKEIKANDDEIVLSWDLNGEKLISKINLENKKLYICNSPDNPNQKNRTTLIIRSNNEEKASFKIEWKC